MSSSPRLSDLASVLHELQMASPPASSEGGTAGVDSPAGSSFTNISHAEVKTDSPSSTSRGESTLDSKHVAMSVTTVQGQSNAKKYKIWVAPSAPDDLCCQLIGQGSTFCVQHQCTTKHKNNQCFKPKAGMAFVLKSTTAAFCDPSIDSGLIGDKLLSKWAKDSCTLEEWISRFLLVEHEMDFPNLRNPDEKISELDFLVKEEESSKTLAFKTPAKRRKVSQNQLVVDKPEFHNLFPDDEPFLEMGSSPQETLENSVKKLSLLAKAVESTYSQQQQDMQVVVDGFRKFELKFLEHENQLGKRPEALEVKFNAPNLWLTLGLIAEEIDTSQISTQIKNLESSFQHILSAQPPDPVKIVKQQVAPIYQQISQLNSFVVDATRMLNSKIGHNNTNNSTSGIDLQKIEEKEKLFLTKLTELEDEIKTLKAASDSAAIRFGQLGFRTAAEADLWIEMHHPGQDFGLLMDFHLTMEHINVQLTGQKLMSNFEKIHKMKLESNNQALAISSFETRIPRFFSTDGSTYVRKDESYFSNIKSWDDWDRPNDGYRDRLLLELQLFKVGHMETLDVKLQPLTPYYNLCVLALTESVSWVEGLAKFVDDTYNEYSRCRYGSVKAFHITTRLCKSLIEHVAKPRNSVQNSFRISNPADVSKAITYSSLKSLDNMMSISSVGFKNSPIITAELSKFLALNSNFDVVDKLQGKLTTLENEQAVLKRDVKQAASAAHTASNKVDSQIKSTLDDLKRRIKGLESKS